MWSVPDALLRISLFYSNRFLLPFSTLVIIAAIMPLRLSIVFNKLGVGHE